MNASSALPGRLRRGSCGRRTLRAALAVALAGVLATSACAAGQQAETAQEKATIDGTNVDVGSIGLRGLAIETPDAATYPVGSSPAMKLVMVNDSDSSDQLLSIRSSVAQGWGTFTSAQRFLDYKDFQAFSSPSASTSATSSPTGSSSSATSGAPTTSDTPSSSTTSSAASSPSASTTAVAPTASTSAVTVPSGAAVSYGVPAGGNKVIALLDTKSVLYPGTTVSLTFTFAKAGTKTVQVPVQLSDAGAVSSTPSYLPSSPDSN